MTKTFNKARDAISITGNILHIFEKILNENNYIIEKKKEKKTFNALNKIPRRYKL